jgi:hypothetical protein
MEKKIIIKSENTELTGEQFEIVKSKIQDLAEYIFKIDESIVVEITGFVADYNMKYNKILIKQDGAYAFRKPLHVFSDGKTEEDSPMYQQAYQQALDNVVKFRDTIVTWKTMYTDGLFKGDTWLDQLGKTYQCPSGFEIVIKNGYATLKNIK